MFNNYILKRRGLTFPWLSLDTEENYQELQCNDQPNYSKDSFDYKFNSDGFRSDSFSEKADLPILFMGCSFTEGIGLPINKIWANLLLDDIKKLPQNLNKNIPFFSLAVGGSGLDTEARYLYKFCKKIKPKYIFYLLSSFYRRDYAYDNIYLDYWIPNKEVNKEVELLFSSEEFAYHQSYRSLCTIDALADYNDSKVVIFVLDFEKKFFSYDGEFSNITFCPIANQNLTVGRLARDNMHPGEMWHSSVKNYMQEYINTRDDLKEDLCLPFIMP